MNANLEKIHDYFKKQGVEDEKLKGWDSSSVYLAKEIMLYAHRNQKRENGEDYANHPLRCLETYRRLVGIKPHDFFCIDEDLMYEHGIPFSGVQEVCLLHDVVEDTEFTLDDVRDLYVECGFENYFDIYIKNALEFITHDKSMGYEEYIEICLRNPISALVKMIDMQDNLRIMDLAYFDEERFKRARKYLLYAYAINEVYHFVERAKEYRKDFAED